MTEEESLCFPMTETRLARVPGRLASWGFVFGVWGSISQVVGEERDGPAGRPLSLM